jgi:hypothetical protein
LACGWRRGQERLDSVRHARLLFSRRSRRFSGLEYLTGPRCPAGCVGSVRRERTAFRAMRCMANTEWPDSPEAAAPRPTQTGATPSAEAVPPLNPAAETPTVVDLRYLTGPRCPAGCVGSVRRERTAFRAMRCMPEAAAPRPTQTGATPSAEAVPPLNPAAETPTPHQSSSVRGATSGCKSRKASAIEFWRVERASVGGAVGRRSRRLARSCCSSPDPDGRNPLRRGSPALEPGS